MLCPKCSAENPAEARFCGKCGNTLKSAPPQTADGPRPAPKKSWLTPPILLAVAAVIALGIVGLSMIAYLANAHKNEPPQAGGSRKTASTTATLPMAAESATPPAKESPPENSAAASDALYRKKATGNWRVRKQWDASTYMEMLCAYNANGTINWSGTVTAQRQQYYIVMSGTWEIKDGCLNVTIDSSNIPQIIPPGHKSSSRIITLTDSEWSYVDTLDGETDTAVRVKSAN